MGRGWEQPGHGPTSTMATGTSRTPRAVAGCQSRLAQAWHGRSVPEPGGWEMAWGSSRAGAAYVLIGLSSAAAVWQARSSEHLRAVRGESGAPACSRQPGAGLTPSGAEPRGGRGRGRARSQPGKPHNLLRTQLDAIINRHFAQAEGREHGGKSVPRAGNIPTALAEGPRVLAFSAETKEFL